jgi:hypothetical protein
MKTMLYAFCAIGPSEVRALPMRCCRRAAWQTKWPLSWSERSACTARAVVADGLRGKRTGH